MNRNHVNPIRLSRNIRRILKLKSNAKSSVKVSSEGKRTYWLPCLKNTILVIIAITLAETFRINEIARCLPIASSDKHKQKRLLRFLDRSYPTAPAMKQWAFFVLQKTTDDFVLPRKELMSIGSSRFLRVKVVYYAIARAVRKLLLPTVPIREHISIV